MIPRHPYFTTRKDEQREAAIAKRAIEARAFLARKELERRQMAGRRVLH
jgi:hypothetical protein